MKEMIKSNGLRISASVRVAETQDGAVLLDVKQGLCFGVNPIGTVIWKHVSEGCEPNQISRHLADTFNISTEQAYNDVQEFLQELKQKQLVKEPDSTERQSGRRSGLVELFVSLSKLVRNRRTNNTE
jgi:hypothetical protein